MAPYSTTLYVILFHKFACVEKRRKCTALCKQIRRGRCQMWDVKYQDGSRVFAWSSWCTIKLLAYIYMARQIVLAPYQSSAMVSTKWSKPRILYSFRWVHIVYEIKPINSEELPQPYEEIECRDLTSWNFSTCLSDWVTNGSWLCIFAFLNGFDLSCSELCISRCHNVMRWTYRFEFDDWITY